MLFEGVNLGLEKLQNQDSSALNHSKYVLVLCVIRITGNEKVLKV